MCNRTVIPPFTLAIGTALLTALGATAYAGLTGDIDRAAAQAEVRNRVTTGSPHKTAATGLEATHASPARPAGPLSLDAHVHRTRAPSLEGIRFARVTLAQAPQAPAPAPGAPVEPAPGTSVAAGPGEVPAIRNTFSLTDDLRNMPRTLWDDTRGVYTKPLPVTLLLLAGGAAVALRPEVDDEFEDHFDRTRAFDEQWGEVADWVGNPGTHFAMAGLWYVMGLDTQNAKTVSVGKTLVSTLIINDLSTLLIKLAAHTEAPNGQEFAFPSGHASSSFAFAAVMDRSYGPAVGWPLYALAGWVSYMRMEDREHHFSDIVFGGAMGLIIGHAVAGGHMPEIAGGVVLPYADPVTGSAGVAWVKSVK